MPAGNSATDIGYFVAQAPKHSEPLNAAKPVMARLVLLKNSLRLQMVPAWVAAAKSTALRSEGDRFAALRETDLRGSQSTGRN